MFSRNAASIADRNFSYCSSVARIRVDALPIFLCVRSVKRIVSFFIIGMLKEVRDWISFSSPSSEDMNNGNGICDDLVDRCLGNDIY